MQNCDRGIKSYSPLLLKVSPSRNKMALWHKICCFSVQEFSQTHIFQEPFHDFRQESGFLALLMAGKGQGLFFTSEKGQGAFLTSKKGQGAILSLKKKVGHIF